MADSRWAMRSFAAPGLELETFAGGVGGRFHPGDDSTDHKDAKPQESMKNTELGEESRRSEEQQD
jgi:hypothetical protein